MPFTAHKIVGWGLLTVFGLLTLAIFLETDWSGPFPLLKSLPLVAILAGLLVLPAMMVLKRKWDELSAVLSGVVCLPLFFFFVTRAPDFVDWLMNRYDHALWIAPVGLLVIILAWVLPMKLHRILRPRIERLLSSAK